MICPPDQLDYQIARHLSMHRRQWPIPRQVDLFAWLDEPTACASAYGLCERGMR